MVTRMCLDVTYNDCLFCMLKHYVTLGPYLRYHAKINKVGNICGS